MTYTIESINEMLCKIEKSNGSLSCQDGQMFLINEALMKEFYISSPSIIRQLVDEVERLEGKEILRRSLAELQSKDLDKIDAWLADRNKTLDELQRLQAENEKLVGRVEELRKLDTLSREIDGEEIQRLKDDLASSEDCTKRVAHQYVHLKKDMERLQSQLAKYEKALKSVLPFFAEDMPDGPMSEKGCASNEYRESYRLILEALKQLENPK